MGKLALVLKTSASWLLVTGISLTLAVQFAIGTRITCPPARLYTPPVRVCDPELWPFLTYPLYSAAHYAGEELPPTLTWPTPFTCASFCASTVDAASYSLPCGRLSEVSAIIMMGASAGLTL